MLITLLISVIIIWLIIFDSFNLVYDFSFKQLLYSTPHANMNNLSLKRSMHILSISHINLLFVKLTRIYEFKKIYWHKDLINLEKSRRIPSAF